MRRRVAWRLVVITEVVLAMVFSLWVKHQAMPLLRRSAAVERGDILTRDMLPEAYSTVIAQHALSALVFAAHWCKPCRAELAELSRVPEVKTGELGVVAVVSPEQCRLDRAVIGRFIPTAKVVCDDALADQWSIQTIPTTIFVTRGGRVMGVNEGRASGTISDDVKAWVPLAEEFHRLGDPRDP